jgi:hypothetical protein
MTSLNMVILLSSCMVVTQVYTCGLVLHITIRTHDERDIARHIRVFTIGEHNNIQVNELLIHPPMPCTMRR